MTISVINLMTILDSFSYSMESQSMVSVISLDFLGGLFFDGGLFLGHDFLKQK